MTHLEIENLASDYLEGSLDQVRHAQVEKHLESCVSCRELVEDVRSAIHACQAAGEALPPPWLVARIRHATLGEKPPSLLEQLDRLVGLFRQPRFAYGVAMAVLSISVIVNASGFKLQDLSLEDLNPATWYNQVNRAGHLFYAHAEKFYYDLRIVYEIESRFRDVQVERGEEQVPAGKPKTAPGSAATTTGADHTKFAFEKLNALQLGVHRSRGVHIHEMR